MPRKFVVLFPDLHGNATAEGGFVKRIRAVAPEAIIVPIINGPESPDELKHNVRHAQDCEPLITTAQGLYETLRTGYQHVMLEYPGLPVVRLNTAEHPVELIPHFAAAVMYEPLKLLIGDFAINECFVEESSDRLIHQTVLPKLFEMTTVGQLSLTCVHDYQAFGAGVLARILTSVDIIISRCAELDPTFDTVGIKWACDPAIACAAILDSEVTVQVHKVIPTVIRNRKNEKIAAQFVSNLPICLATYEFMTAKAVMKSKIS